MDKCTLNAVDANGFLANFFLHIILNTKHQMLKDTALSVQSS